MSLPIWTAMTATLTEALKGGWAGIATAGAKALVIGGAMTAAYMKLDSIFTDMEKKSSAFKMPEFAPVMEMPSPMAPIPMLEWSKLLKSDKDKGRKGPPKAEVYIENARFDIKQAFAEGFDPDRIAAAFVEQIGSTTMYMGQSQFASATTAGG
jgi:hypothetical protein